ncbi:acid-sensing ion channel 1-like [Lytechinus variegatus]|uniref:acid-sensing ion channel 1-like n=1 Tax=Lytechinus variegatus TaxID=7654 RepID=UPI001BB1CBE7|nr:acid-sensing ion channel 1-like [Lytechinus variegatus]
MPLQQVQLSPFAGGPRTFLDGPGLKTISGLTKPGIEDFHVDIPVSVKYRDRVSWLAVFYKSVPEAIGIGGLKYVFNPAEMKLRRLFWLFLIIAAFALLLVQISDRAKHLSRNPTSVDVYQNYTESLPFPTVAICNYNQLRRSMVEGTELGDFLQTYTFDYHSIKTMDTSSPFFPLLSNHTMTDIFTTYGHQLEQTVEFAIFGKTRALDRDTYFSTKITDFGLCTVFNDAESGNPPLLIKRPGALSGLQLRLNVEAAEYFWSPSFRPSSGFQIVIYEYGSQPLIEDQGFGIAPGTHSHIGVEVIEALNQEPPYGLCHDKQLKYFDRYGYAECYLECMGNFSVNACGCSGCGVFNVSDAQECTLWETFTCTSGSFADFVENETCDCPVACRVLTYQPSISTTKYPTTTWAEYYQSLSPELKLGDYMKENICYVSIYFKEISIKQITQNIDYNYFSFLCDIGGSLGLWLGGSILTVFEILDLFGNSMYTYTLRFQNVKK